MIMCLSGEEQPTASLSMTTFEYQGQYVLLAKKGHKEHVQYRHFL